MVGRKSCLPWPQGRNTHYQRYYKMMPSGLDFTRQAKSRWPCCWPKRLGGHLCPNGVGTLVLSSFRVFLRFLTLLWSFVSIRSGLCEHFWLVCMICGPINAAAGHADVYANKDITIIRVKDLLTVVFCLCSTSVKCWSIWLRSLLIASTSMLRCFLVVCNWDLVAIVEIVERRSDLVAFSINLVSFAMVTSELSTIDLVSFKLILLSFTIACVFWSSKLVWRRSSRIASMVLEVSLWYLLKAVAIEWTSNTSLEICRSRWSNFFSSCLFCCWRFITSRQRLASREDVQISAVGVWQKTNLLIQTPDSGLD